MAASPRRSSSTGRWCRPARRSAAVRRLRGRLAPICLQHRRDARVKFLATAAQERAVGSILRCASVAAAPIGRGQRREAKVRLTLRWRGLNSNHRFRVANEKIPFENRNRHGGEKVRLGSLSSGYRWFESSPLQRSAGSGAAIGAAAAGGHGAALGTAVGGAVGAVGGLITTPAPARYRY